MFIFLSIYYTGMFSSSVSHNPDYLMSSVDTIQRD